MNPVRMVAMILTALMVLYPLSIGPVYRHYVVHQGLRPPLPPWFHTFYRPLAWACGRVPGLGAAFDWYGGVWV